MTTSKRTVSIVIPCLDDAVLLRRCLASLHDQVRRPDEVIVVDNGSTDASATVAREAGAIVVEEPRRGITWATRTGFDAATGDVLVRTDADVRAPVDYVERLHAAWDEAEHSAGQDVVGVTGTARFEIPGWRGEVISRLYVGAYRRAVGLALGHPPLFGTNYSIRAEWWRAVRDDVDSADTFAHEDMQISFRVGPQETVWFDPALTLDMDARALFGFRQVVTRFRRGLHTVLGSWQQQPPHHRLAARGLLGSRLQRKFEHTVVTTGR